MGTWKPSSFPGSGRTCDGVSRRDFIRVGALSFFGLALPDFLRLRQAAAATGARADACILLWLGGGPSQLDTFDPKPDAPDEIRGEFKPIPTNVPGIRLGEHLPLTAQVMDKVALVRSLTSSSRPTSRQASTCSPATAAAHAGVPELRRGGREGTEHPQQPAPLRRHPRRRARRAVGLHRDRLQRLHHRRSCPPELPVQNFDLPRDETMARLQKRRAFVERANDRFASDLPDDSVRAVDTFYQHAYDLVSSPQAKQGVRPEPGGREDPRALRDDHLRAGLPAGAAAGGGGQPASSPSRSRAGTPTRRTSSASPGSCCRSSDQRLRRAADRPGAARGCSSAPWSS